MLAPTPPRSTERGPDHDSVYSRRSRWPFGQRLHLRQGIEISRPSDLYLSANLTGETVSEVRVAGSTVPVATGRFFLE